MNHDRQPGPEDPDGDHPEIAGDDPEVKLPASAGTKREALDLVEGLLGENPDPTQSRWGGDFRDPDDGRPINVSRVVLGADSDNPNTVAVVIVMDVSRGDKKSSSSEIYRFLQAPDGLEVEYDYRLWPPQSETSIPPWEMHTFEDRIDTLVAEGMALGERVRQSDAEERAAGLKFFSQKKAEELRDRLGRAERRRPL